MSGRHTYFDEHGKILTPITLDQTPLRTLNQTLEPIHSIVPNLDTFAFVSNSQFSDRAFGLTKDQAAAIHLYTQESHPKQNSLYFKLNQALRTEDREAIKPYFHYLKLLINALSCIPSHYSPSMVLWRGISGDVSGQYQANQYYWWWGFSSCSVDKNVAISFLGGYSPSNPSVLFQIHLRTHAVDIYNYSTYKKEKEVLLLPARCLKVVSKSMIASGLTHIELVEDSNVPNLITGVNFPQLSWNSLRPGLGVQYECCGQRVIFNFGKGTLSLPMEVSTITCPLCRQSLQDPDKMLMWWFTACNLKWEGVIKGGAKENGSQDFDRADNFNVHPPTGWLWITLVVS